MASVLLQIKIDPSFKKEVAAIAKYKGLSVSAFIKMVLKNALRKEKREIITENGLTLAEEEEVLRRWEEMKKGKLKTFHSAEELMNYLNADD